MQRKIFMFYYNVSNYLSLDLLFNHTFIENNFMKTLHTWLSGKH